MLAAVDLHQLADAVAPRTGLMNAFQALLSVKPQPVALCSSSDQTPDALMTLYHNRFTEQIECWRRR